MLCATRLTVLAAAATTSLVLAACGADPSLTPAPTPIVSAETTPSASPAATPSSTPVASRTPSATPTPTASPTAPSAPADTHFYGNLTLYPVPAARPEANPGAGYTVVFTEGIIRHGSRSLTTATDDKRALALWQQASDAGELTDLGQGFGPAVRRLQKAMKTVGYGELSKRGKQDQRALGAREGARLRSYFASVARAGGSVQIRDTGVSRTETSAENFVRGLESTRSTLEVGAPKSEGDLHFGDTDPAYQDFLDHDKAWPAAYAKAVNSKALKAAAVQGLRRLYSADFVGQISNPVTQARSIWDLYRVQPAMSKDTSVDLAPFMDPTTAAALAFADDARFFYSRGPGITGTDGAHSAAQPLLDDFVSVADKRLAGGSTAAVYRFAHDLEIAPFAALLELPSSRQLGSTKDVYSWATSNFRTASVVPLAANIEWTLWRNRRGRVLVQVRQNEVPVTLGYSCQPAVRTGSFYEWTEVKRCLTYG